MRLLAPALSAALLLLAAPAGAALPDGAKLKPSRHAYNPDGSYFKVTFGNRRLVFETDGSEVTGMHGGRIPEVDYVEACA